MYRALYDFKAEQKDCLSFKSGDIFTAMGDCSGDWLKVQNGFGLSGLVPYNYVALVLNQGNGVIDDVLKSIDRAIEAIHCAAAKTGTYTKEQRKNLQALVEHRQRVANDEKMSGSKKSTPVSSPNDVPPQPKRTAPMLTSPVDSDQLPNNRIENKRPCVKREAPAPPPRTSSQLQATTPQESDTPFTRTSSGSRPVSGTFSPLSTCHPDGGSPQNRRTDNITAQVADQLSHIHSATSQESESAATRTDSVARPASGTFSQLHPSKPEELDVPAPPSDNITVSPFDTDFPSPPDEQEFDFPHPPDLSGFSNTSEEPSFFDCPTMDVSSVSHASQPSSVVTSYTLTSDVSVPVGLGHELVEDVRRNTGLSYNKTLIAVETVLKLIGSHVPCTQVIMGKVSQVLYQAQHSEVDVDGCHDAQRLGVIFSELSACKNDSQQRSWALYEDESIILQHLQEMICILENANPSLCRKCIAVDNYEPLHTLVQYYQMETRASIRFTMLKGFQVLCHLDANAVTALLYSVLPLELCTDLQSNITDTDRTCSSALVLTMVLSMGEDVPIHHYVHLNKDFVCFVLDKIESPPAEDSAERIPDFFVTLILAFNLHFRFLEKNLVMAVLGERGTATVFTEKLMLLVNRGDDPVRMLPHTPKPANALLKFLTDMYSVPATSDLLYTNDAMVLIDIIIRQLSDLPVGDKARTENLTLIRLILTNSPYKESRYRLEDLHRCLLNILKEEEEAAVSDKLEVQKTFSGHPDLFPVASPKTDA